MTPGIRRERELGYCAVTTHHGSGWHLERGEFTRVRIAWLKGCRFVDARQFHGEAITIRLRDVDSVIDVTPEAIALSLAESRADDADDSLNFTR